VARVALAGAAAGVAIVGLLVADLVGGATAQTTTSSSPAPAPPRVVSVEGIGTAPLSSAADAATATAAYRAAQGAAVSDGLTKAQFLAGKAGVDVGEVQSIAEDGGYVDCGSGDYTGVQPDFGSPSGGFLSASSAPASGAASPAAPKPKAKAKKKSKKKAKSAQAVTCTVQAQVSLSYQLQ
jgi:Protein of unknown function (DUF541)